MDDEVDKSVDDLLAEVSTELEDSEKSKTGFVYEDISVSFNGR